MLHLQTILHPTDFSEASDCALRLACELARHQGGRLILLHVVPPPIAHGELLARRGPDGFDDEMQQNMQRRMAEHPGLPIETWLDHGDPATVILDHAQESHADLIVMGTHGRTGLRRLLMGSVAEAVMRKGRCPVMTTRP